MLNITFCQLDQNTTGIKRGEHLMHACRQTANGTEVWNRITGEMIKMPKRQYTLCSSKGAAEFIADFSKVA